MAETALRPDATTQPVRDKKVEQPLTPEQIQVIRNEGGLEDVDISDLEKLIPNVDDLNMRSFEKSGIHPHELRAFVEAVYIFLESPFFRDGFGDDHRERTKWIKAIEGRYGSLGMRYLKENRATGSKLWAFSACLDRFLIKIVRQGFHEGVNLSKEEGLKEKINNIEKLKKRMEPIYRKAAEMTMKERIEFAKEATEVAIEVLNVFKREEEKPEG